MYVHILHVHTHTYRSIPTDTHSFGAPQGRARGCALATHRAPYIALATYRSRHCNAYRSIHIPIGPYITLAHFGQALSAAHGILA